MSKLDDVKVPPRPDITTIRACRTWSPTRSNTVSTQRVPIVFVPGVMGTRLDLSGARWDPNSAAEMAKNWVSVDAYTEARRACTDPSFRAPWEPPEPKETVINEPIKIDDKELKTIAGADKYFGMDRGWSALAWEFYGDILITLEKSLNRGRGVLGDFPVFAFGYDWRRDNRIAAAQLAQTVEKLCNEGGFPTIILVTHSMGGLVSRYAMKHFGLERRVSGVVHVVQPMEGAVIAYRRTVDGLDAEKTLRDPLSYPAVATFGGSWYGWSMMLASAEGPMQLLPSQFHPEWLKDASGRPVDGSRIYDFYADFSSDYCILRKPERSTLEELARGSMGESHDPAERAREIREVKWEQGHAIVPFDLMKKWCDRVESRWNKLRDRLRPGLALARSFHADVHGYAHPITFLLYATGRVTDIGVDLTKPFGKRGIRVPGGDGTVDAQSAMALDDTVRARWRATLPPGSRLIVPEAISTGAQEHGAVFADGDVKWALLQRIDLLRYAALKQRRQYP